MGDVCNAYCPSDSTVYALDLPLCNDTCNVRAGECDNTKRRERFCLILPDLDRFTNTNPGTRHWLSNIQAEFGMTPDVPDSLCDLDLENDYWVEQSVRSFNVGGDLDSIRTAITYTVCGPTCTPPQEGEYVKTACEIGVDSGADTYSVSCHTPTFGVNFTAHTCIRGSIDSEGRNTRFDSCTYPEHGEFVERVCVSGWYDSIGRDTYRLTCKLPNDETYPNFDSDQRVARTGCRDPDAENYDSTALIDGNCVLYGCTDIYSPNYNYRATRHDSTDC